MSEQTLRVGIVGAGWIARKAQLPYFADRRGIRLVGIVDPLPDTDVVARDWGTTTYASLEALIPDVDVVCVCTPGPTHAELIRICLLAQKHVICEKPLAMTSGEVAELMGLARRNGVGMFCCMTNRYRADVQYMAQRIREGSIGAPRMLTFSWLRSRGVPARPGPLSQGVLWDLGSHLADLALWMTEWDPTESAVTAQATRLRPAGAPLVASWYGSACVDVTPPAYDTVLLTAQGTDGTLCRIEASWDSGLPHDMCRLLVVGEAGALMLQTVFGWSPHRQTVETPALSMSHDGGPWTPSYVPQDRQHTEYSAQFDHLIGAVRGNTTWITDMEPTRKSIHLLERAEGILEQGRPI
ncbi:Gfo/Idh/MocA family protein [Kribbella sp. NPDC051620]|uniref:Gfo/Idh/MocA family protein n=1 Tax=Kribbella sp. NPDC051620 TaxID=3364120 RepID=UPI003790C532